MGVIPKKLLLVDDSKLLHHMYDVELKHFKDAGCTLYFANNGEEAFVYLQDNPDMDLVILDVNMPVMTGMQFLEKRQREGLFADIPVVLVTVNGSKEDVVAGLQAGINGYLKKPVKSQDLVRMVEKVLAG